MNTTLIIIGGVSAGLAVVAGVILAVKHFRKGKGEPKDGEYIIDRFPIDGPNPPFMIRFRGRKSENKSAQDVQEIVQSTDQPSEPKVEEKKPSLFTAAFKKVKEDVKIALMNAKHLVTITIPAWLQYKYLATCAFIKGLPKACVLAHACGWIVKTIDLVVSSIIVAVCGIAATLYVIGLDLLKAVAIGIAFWSIVACVLCHVAWKMITIVVGSIWDTMKDVWNWLFAFPGDPCDGCIHFNTWSCFECNYGYSGYETCRI